MPKNEENTLQNRGIEGLSEEQKPEEKKPDEVKKRREKGSGGLTKRKDGTWQGKFDAGVKADGKRDIKYVYAKTQPECKKKLRELIRQIQKSDYVTVRKGSVQKYMDEWFNTTKKSNLKPKSVDRLEGTLRYDVYPYIGDIQLANLKAKDVQDMINKLKADGKAYSTIKKAYEAVNACFKTGVKQKTVASNPAEGVSLPSRSLFPRKEIPFYKQEEAALLCEQSMQRWSNGTRKYRLGAYVPLMINTGLRIGELLGLQWERDVDLENKTITVRSNLVRTKNREDDSKKYTLMEQDSVKTTAGQDRVIPLNTQAYNALTDLQQITGASKYVMATKSGEHLSPRNADRTLRTIAEHAGFPEEKIYGPHALRHTFATLLLSNGTDIKTVSKLLGHSDVSVTYNTYIHVIESQERKAVDSIPDLTANHAKDKADTETKKQ